MTLQNRIATLEKEVAALKQRVENGTTGQSEKSWFDVMAGAFENDPEFDEVLRLGREFRQSQDQRGNNP